MREKLLLIIACIMTFPVHECRAQRFSLSTNLLDYVALGTMNVEGAYSLSRHCSIVAGARYNPFIFRKSDPERQFQLRQQSYSIGVRVWPWHIWSGWWFAGKGRYQEYNFGGLTGRRTVEGDRAGIGLYAGYTYMLSPHFNMEFAAGLWGGVDFFCEYSCQVCGMTVNKGRRGFVLPDDIMIALVYVF